MTTDSIMESMIVMTQAFADQAHHASIDATIRRLWKTGLADWFCYAHALGELVYEASYKRLLWNVALDIPDGSDTGILAIVLVARDPDGDSVVGPYAPAIVGRVKPGMGAAEFTVAEIAAGGRLRRARGAPTCPVGQVDAEVVARIAGQWSDLANTRAAARVKGKAPPKDLAGRFNGRLGR